MKRFEFIVGTLGIVLIVATGKAAEWVPQTIATTADFRGLWAVDDKIAWVSGTQGTIGRTVDGGTKWNVMTVPGAEKLDFRDVKAFSDRVAYALSIGAGELSRIYKTTDGGKTWQLQFKNDEAAAFYNCMAFWDETHGIAMSDPVNGRYRILATDDGQTWKVMPAENMPPALAKEGAFAASGTCLITRGKNDAYLLTGGDTAARVFHSTDRGQSWTVITIPLAAKTDSAGAFAVAYRDDTAALIVGGDYRKPGEAGATLARTEDGGKTWTGLDNKLPFRSGIAYARDRWIAVGTSGSDSSKDDGQTWTRIDQKTWNVVRSTPDGTTWAAGPKGLLAKFKP